MCYENTDKTLTFAVILVFSDIRTSLDSFQAVFCLFSLYLIEVEQILLDADISHAYGIWYPMFLCANLGKSLFTSTRQFVKPKEWCTCILNFFRVRVWKLPAPLKVLIWIVKSEKHNTQINWGEKSSLQV